MTERGKELMGEFIKNYPRTKGAAENWWNNLSMEDKQEVITEMQNAVVAINEALEVMRLAIIGVVEDINTAFAEFSKVCLGYEKERKV